MRWDSDISCNCKPSIILLIISLVAIAVLLNM